jgi:hypothetical protein
MDGPKDVQGDDGPRSMCDAGVRERRRGMLSLPHVAPLTSYAARLRDRAVPWKSRSLTRSMAV